jgi:hypothetical protein
VYELRGSVAFHQGCAWLGKKGIVAHRRSPPGAPPDLDKGFGGKRDARVRSTEG